MVTIHVCISRRGHSPWFLLATIVKASTLLEKLSLHRELMVKSENEAKMAEAKKAESLDCKEIHPVGHAPGSYIRDRQELPHQTTQYRPSTHSTLVRFEAFLTHLLKP